MMGSENAATSTTFTIQPLAQFDFLKPQEWDKSIGMNKRLASNLHISSQENQVNTWVHCMGNKADDVLRGQSLDVNEWLLYNVMKEFGRVFHAKEKRNLWEGHI